MPSRFKIRKGTISVPSGTSGTTTIGLGATYGRVVNFNAKATTDTLTQLELKDSEGNIFYKDAADKDYATAKVFRTFIRDDTPTGLGFSPTDATGAALAAGQVIDLGSAVIKGPVTVTWSNVTAVDSIAIELLTEI